MKLCLISTTVHSPKVYDLFRRFGPDVEIIVAGDCNTPHEKITALFSTLGNARYLDVAGQRRLGYACSELIGWNCIQRRNVALLEAIKSKADIIVTVDDDNIPIASDYFDHFRRIFSQPFSGLIADAKANGRVDQRWFDVGRLLVPPAIHRGFPSNLRHLDIGPILTPAIDAKVGVAAGLWMGAPDTDAPNRIVNQPVTYGWSEVLRAGVLVKPGCFAPFNSQNTAYTHELAPLMMVLPFVGRYDDIWASYIAERVMMERDEHVHFGPPLVWQERNAHDFVNDLSEEMLGLKYTQRFVQDLCGTDIGKGTPVTQMRRIFEKLDGCAYMPKQTVKVGLTWCDDVERISA
jgi:hypothetical protein